MAHEVTGPASGRPWAANTYSTLEVCVGRRRATPGANDGDWGPRGAENGDPKACRRAEPLRAQ